MLPPANAAVLRLLTETPRRIAQAAAGLSEKQLQQKPDKDSWSACEILAHLRACADVWERSIRTILNEDRPALRHISPRAWIRKTNYTRLTFEESLQAFQSQRIALLQLLNGLSEEDWSRRASVKMATQTREETVFSYAQRIAQHEAGHCDQIDRTIAGY